MQDADQSVLGSDNALTTNLGKKHGMNGAEFSVTGNLSEHFGLQFDVSTRRNNRNFAVSGATLQQKYTFTDILGGIQIKNSAKDSPRLKPFFHALFGVARQDVKLSGLSGAV